MEVFHTQFGQGTVLGQDRKTATVDFKGVIKKMLLKYSNLTMADGSEFKGLKKERVKNGKISTEIKNMSDTELMCAYNDLMNELLDAKEEARLDGKTGTRGSK